MQQFFSELAMREEPNIQRLNEQDGAAAVLIQENRDRQLVKNVIAMSDREFQQYLAGLLQPI